MIAVPNDADLEAMELAAYADELDAETCRSCGEAYQSISLFCGARDGQHVEEYECICGHVARWVNRRRLS